MNKLNKGILVYFLTLFILAILSAYYLLPKIPDKEDLGVNGTLRIIDGDTFEYDGKIIRLICIDSPEKGKEGYEEASVFLGSLLIGRNLTFESDVEDKDDYGRLLRYIYSDGVFVNKKMVEFGYANVFRYGNSTKKCDEIEDKD